MIQLEDLVVEQMCLLLIWQSHCGNEKMENKLVFFFMYQICDSIKHAKNCTDFTGPDTKKKIITW